MSKPLVIFGVGSLARLAFYYAARDMGLRVLGFVVDENKKTIDEFCGLPVITWETCLSLYSPDETDFYIALGYRVMRQRQHLYERVKSEGYNFQNIISNSSFVAETAYIGENNFIMPGSVIEPEVYLGTNNVLWSNSTICHNSVIGDHNFFAANSTIGGEVSVGNCCFLGFTSTVVQERTIDDDVLVAAQSLLLKDGERLGCYQGVPAKRVKSFSPLIGVHFK